VYLRNLAVVLIRLISFSAQSQKFEETKAKAEQGDVDAQYNLALMYDNGAGCQKADRKHFVSRARCLAPYVHHLPCR